MDTTAGAPHSSTRAWRIPWTEEPGRLQSMGVLRVGHDWATSLSLSRIGEGNGNPLQCSCLENPRDGGAWWATVYGVAHSQTQLKRLSSSSRPSIYNMKYSRQMNSNLRHWFSRQECSVTIGLQLVPCLVTRDRYIHIYESNTIGIIEDLGQNQKALVVFSRGWFYKIHF